LQGGVARGCLVGQENRLITSLCLKSYSDRESNLDQKTGKRKGPHQKRGRLETCPQNIRDKGGFGDKTNPLKKGKLEGRVNITQ